MPGPLEGYRVLELSRILAGPWAGQIFADMGATVIKVERPGEGDNTRHWGPPWLTASNADASSEAAYFLCANRGKQSITVDIATPEGQQRIRDLVAQSDVLIENYKVGGLAKYGLDYAALQPLNPRLVYCSITGFGQTGPYAQRAGYDFLLQGMGGLMSVTGEPDGLPGGGPQKAGVALVDILTGLYASIAVQAALLERERSGLGQYIDLALLDVSVACLANQAMNYLVGGEVPRRLGNAHPNIVPYQTFAAADGHLILAVGNDTQFRRFCEVAGWPALADDLRYATNRGRVANREELCAYIAVLIKTRTIDDWLLALEAVGVPCGPINTLDRVFADPQVKARGMVQQLRRADGVCVPSVRNPIVFSRTPLATPVVPPRLGEHDA
ncbi:MAG: CoA transferase [Pseudomonadales bacterium]|nr:CoA transferase [Pseudomonadales bacterium]